MTVSGRDIYAAADMFRVLTLIVALIAAAIAPALADIAGPARVIDGDTIDIAGERIRLHGIDAPESGQTCHRDGKLLVN